MKLESVKKLLNIYIESEELNRYIQALDDIIIESVAIKETDAIHILKSLFQELTRIKNNARDY